MRRRQLPEVPERLEIGKGPHRPEGKRSPPSSAPGRGALKAAEALEARPFNQRRRRAFAKPLDEALILPFSPATNCGDREEASIGGCGAHVLTMASDEGLIDAGLKLRTLRLPDHFQDQDKPEKQYAEAGLDADGIVEAVLKALRHNSAGVAEGARA